MLLRTRHTSTWSPPSPRIGRHRHPSLVQSGFTLSETLVAATLGLIVVAAAGSVLISHIRTVTVQTVQLRFQNDWARVSQLIETEVAEGVTLTPVAGGGCAAGITLFTINVPVIRPVTAGEVPETTAPSVALTPAGDVQISYNQVGPDLQRCGPPINADGTLNITAQPVPVLLLRNATLTIASPLNPGDRFLEYNLTLTDLFPPAFSGPFQRNFPAVGQFVQVRTRLDQVDD